MGTAAVFLVILDALILAGTYSEFRLVLALTVTMAVAATIALIWRKNSALESSKSD